MSDDEDFTYAPKAAVAHSGAPRRNLLSFRKESRGPKCYFCSLCGFTSKDESGIHEHQNVFHPEVPVSELIHFLCVDKSQKKTKNGSEGLRRGRSRHKAKLTRNQIIRAKKLRKLEKKKKLNYSGSESTFREFGKNLLNLFRWMNLRWLSG